MKITLSNIYNNKPYYRIEYENGKTANSFGYEQTKKLINEAKRKGEKIKIEDLIFLKEHNKLVKLIENDKK